MTRFFLPLLIALALVSAAPAYAHDLATDGEVGAVMHIDPNDEPVAGELSTIYLEFKDTDQEFDSSKYVLDISLSVDGAVVSSSMLVASGTDASYDYDFPEAGHYEIAVKGTPISDAPPFTLTYETDASEAVAVSGLGMVGAFFGVHGGHVLITVILILILVYVVVSEKRKERKERVS